MRWHWLALISLSILGCDYNHQKGSPGAGGVPPVGGVPEEKLNHPDYATVNAVVLRDRCVRCHSEAGGRKGDLDLEGYENAKASVDGIEFHVFKKQDMPPRGKLTALEEKVLRNWLDEGAPLKNGCDPANDPDFQCTPLTWENVSARILVPKCVDCHGGTSTEAGLDLTTLSAFRGNVNKIFDRVYVKRDMPQDPVKPMTIEERRALLNWIDLGMPD